MAPSAPGRLADFLLRARRQRDVGAWLADFARALTIGAALALAALLAYERAGPQLSAGGHLLVALGVVAFAGALSALRHALRRAAEPIARRVDERLRSGHLVETASELDGTDGLAGGAAHPCDLCVRAAEQTIAGRAPAELFPYPIPNFRWPAGLLAAIVLAAFLPRWGFLGSGESGIGERPVRPDDPQQSAPRERATLASGKAPKPASAPASAPASSPSRKPKPRPNPSESSPQSKPDPKKNQGKRPDPPQPDPIDPFSSAPKIVPIDPKAAWRSKREALVVEVTQGKASGKPDEAPPSGAPPDEASIRALERASESALAKSSIGARERDFAKRFFEIWLGK
jgi:hypothetical protein